MMKRALLTFIPIFCLLLGISIASCMCLGCVPAPPIPVPPQPGPGPTPPAPVDTVPRSMFDAVHVGDPAAVLSGLPEPERVVPSDGKQVYVWVLNETRPEGGYVRWEVHVVGDQVVASFAW